MLMRARNNSQRTIGLSARIEVKAYGKHFFKDFGWRLNMEDVRLC
jgi:hypothetical protein